MGLLEIVDFLAFIFILVAAFLISSKYVANPKVRMVVFTSYFIACFFLIAWGWMVYGLITFFTLQQTVLIFINIRGIYNAYKDMKKLGGENTLREGEPGYHLNKGASESRSLKTNHIPSLDSKPSEPIPDELMERIMNKKIDGDYDRE